MGKQKTKPVPLEFLSAPPEQFLSFIRVQLQKRGLTVTEAQNGFDFENIYLRGSLTLSPILLTWKVKPGFELVDTPLAAGKSSASFQKIGDALNFLTLRLAKKCS